MFNSGKKFRATKKINILILVLSEKKFLNETKNHNPPPLQVKWLVLNQNPYIEEKTTQWPQEKAQRTNNDLQNRHIKLKIE